MGYVSTGDLTTAQAQVNVALFQKADKSDVYTQSQVNQLLTGFAGTAALSHLVTTDQLNSSVAATTAALQTSIGTKADGALTTLALANKASLAELATAVAPLTTQATMQAVVANAVAPLATAAHLAAAVGPLAPYAAIASAVEAAKRACNITSTSRRTLTSPSWRWPRKQQRWSLQSCRQRSQPTRRGSPHPEPPGTTSTAFGGH
jgi:hypothetical protein